MDDSGHQFVDIYILHSEVGTLMFVHRKLKHFLNLHTESFGLVHDSPRKALHELWSLLHRVVAKHLGCKRDRTDGGLELVGHVVDEVVLQLCQFLLAEDEHEGGYERDEQHEGEDK